MLVSQFAKNCRNFDFEICEGIFDVASEEMRSILGDLPCLEMPDTKKKMTCFQVAVASGAYVLARKLARAQPKCVFNEMPGGIPILEFFFDDSATIKEIINMYSPSSETGFEISVTKSFWYVLGSGKQEYFDMIVNTPAFANYVNAPMESMLPVQYAIKKNDIETIKKIMDCPKFVLDAREPHISETVSSTLMRYGNEEIFQVFDDYFIKHKYTPFQKERFFMMRTRARKNKGKGLIKKAIDHDNVFMLLKITEIFPRLMEQESIFLQNPTCHLNFAINSMAYRCLRVLLSTFPISRQHISVILHSSSYDVFCIFTEIVSTCPELKEKVDNQYHNWKLDWVKNYVYDDRTSSFNVDLQLDESKFRAVYSSISLDIEWRKKRGKLLKFISIRCINSADGVTVGPGVLKSFLDECGAFISKCKYLSPDHNGDMEFSYVDDADWEKFGEYIGEMIMFIGMYVAYCLLSDIKLQFRLAPFIINKLAQTPTQIWSQLDSKFLDNILSIPFENLEDCMIPGCIEITDIFGQKREINMVSTPFVQADNVKEFYANYVLFRVHGGNKHKMLSKFVQGFNNVMPLSYMKTNSGYLENQVDIISREELASLLTPMDSIDISEWKQNTVIELSKDSYAKIITWFWDYVAKCDLEKTRKIIKYATASSNPPVGGFEYYGIIGDPFTIVVDDGDFYPRATTCRNKLKLSGNVPSRERFEEMMDYVLDYADQFYYS